jgi:hypothetical protein
MCVCVLSFCACVYIQASSGVINIHLCLLKFTCGLWLGCRKKNEGTPWIELNENPWPYVCVLSFCVCVCVYKQAVVKLNSWRYCCDLCRRQPEHTCRWPVAHQTCSIHGAVRSSSLLCATLGGSSGGFVWHNFGAFGCVLSLSVVLIWSCYQLSINPCWQRHWEAIKDFKARFLSTNCW